MLQSLTFRGFRIGFGIGFGIGFQIQNMILSKTVLLHAVQGVRARRPDIKMISPPQKPTAHNISTQISLSQVVELIKARHSHDEKSVQLMCNQFRLPHPLHAVQTQQALASGTQPPPTPAAPHIAPLPEGFLAEGAIALSVTLSGGALFAS